MYYRILDYFKLHKYYKQKPNEIKEIFIPFTHPNKKPAWVKERVKYLKVHLPKDGCRKIAIQFNRQYVHENMTVSKSKETF